MPFSIHVKAVFVMTMCSMKFNQRGYNNRIETAFNIKSRASFKSVIEADSNKHIYLLLNAQALCQ